jgi:hypothetical protein
MNRCPLPDAYRLHVEGWMGEQGRAWADSLGALAGRYADAWGLTLGEFLAGGLVSCPLACRDAQGTSWS